VGACEIEIWNGHGPSIQKKNSRGNVPSQCSPRFWAVGPWTQKEVHSASDLHSPPLFPYSGGPCTGRLCRMDFSVPQKQVAPQTGIKKMKREKEKKRNVSPHGSKSVVAKHSSPSLRPFPCISCSDLFVNFHLEMDGIRKCKSGDRSIHYFPIQTVRPLSCSRCSLPLHLTTHINC